MVALLGQVAHQPPESSFAGVHLPSHAFCVMLLGVNKAQDAQSYLNDAVSSNQPHIQRASFCTCSACDEHPPHVNIPYRSF